MELFESLKQKISGKGLKIVFPEGTDARILGAANRLNADGLITPVFIGNVKEVTETLISRGINPEGFEIYDPENCGRFETMTETFMERRKGKVTEEQAKELLKDPNYFGTMLVYMKIADGMVSGAIHSTADTVRPARLDGTPSTRPNYALGARPDHRAPARYSLGRWGHPQWAGPACAAVDILASHPSYSPVALGFRVV